jgi:hypothetical protein
MHTQQRDVKGVVTIAPAFMIEVSIITRTLHEEKTCEDFREAWFHTAGFGTNNKKLTMLKVANPLEVMVIGLTFFASLEAAASLIEIGAKERRGHSLDEVIEPKIRRTFELLMAEDVLSASGKIAFSPARVNGEDTDIDQDQEALSLDQNCRTAISIPTNSRKPLSRRTHSPCACEES